MRQQEAEARTRQRFEQELEVARLIQQNFLPRELPELTGWQVSAYYRPAREVGGDFYDVIPLPEGQVGFVVGDVTDKGVPAALVMAATRSVLRASAQRLVDPGEVLERVNEHLCPDMPDKMFVTCLYGVLEPATGRLRFANAGHDLPYVKTADGVVELRARGMPLGLMTGMAYEEKEYVLAPGDSVLLHSDGVVEAHAPDGDMYGFPRLMDAVDRHPGGGELIDRVLAELDRFTGPGAEQEDDVTMVTLQRTAGASHVDNGAVGKERPRAVLAEFELPSEAGNERLAIDHVSSAVADLGLEEARLRAPQDRGRRGHDERDGARQPLPGRQTGHGARARDPRSPAGPDHRPGRRSADGRAGDPRHRGKARGASAPARLGPLPDPEHGRRDERDERRARTTPSSSPYACKEATMATREAEATVRRRDGIAVIDLVGDINSAAEQTLEAAWSQATSERPEAVALNFAEASYINSTGIALIVGLLARARADGIGMRAWGLTDHYREIFEITRLADFMQITADESSALNGAEGSTDA